MLRPSYSELMDLINENNLVDSKITSRYTIVLAAAKRARQLIDGANPLTYATIDRAVSIAINEMSEKKLMIKVQENMLDGNYERMLTEQNKFKGISGEDDLREEFKDKYEPDSYTLEDDDDDGVEDIEGLYASHFENELKKNSYGLFGNDEYDDPVAE